MLPMCQAKQMWRGDNIYFHNSEQIWRAASLSSGARSCRKPNSLTALEVFIAPLNLHSSEMGCFLLMWGPGLWIGGGGWWRLLQEHLRKSEHGTPLSILNLSGLCGVTWKLTLGQTANIMPPTSRRMQV